MGFIGKAAAVIKRRIRMPKLSSGDRNSMHSGKLSKLEPSTELDPNTVWLDSTLMKRGFYANSTFHLRHIKLTSEFISYSQTDGGSLLDRVWFNDIAGVVFHGMKDEEFEQMFNAQEEFAAERQAAHDLYATLKPMQFAVCCTKDGYHKGRQFIFMASSVGEMEVWVASIVRVFKYNMARDTSYQKISTFAACRRYVRWLYLGDRVQLLVAALIVLNFFLNICDTQLQAEEGTLEYKMLEVADIAFGYIFAFELVVNMFATLVTEFVKDPWNWFDELIVGFPIPNNHNNHNHNHNDADTRARAHTHTHAHTGLTRSSSASRSSRKTFRAFPASPCCASCAPSVSSDFSSASPRLNRFSSVCSSRCPQCATPSPSCAWSRASTPSWPSPSTATNAKTCSATFSLPSLQCSRL